MPDISTDARVATFVSKPAFRIFLFAFLIRLTLVLLVPDLIPEPEDKLERYDPIALSLARGEGFSLRNRPTAEAAPVYPAFLAAIYMVFGHSKMALRIFLSLISAGHCLFFYFIAKRFFGDKIALLTASTLALHPSLIALVFTGTSEGLFLFLHAWFLCSLSAAFEQQAARKFWLSGILLGLTTLCRAVSLLLPGFILPLFALVYKKNLRLGSFYCLLFLIGFASVVAPWIVRNRLVFGGFVPVQTLGGIHFYWATPGRNDAVEGAKERARLKAMDAIGKDQFYYNKALDNIRHSPLEFMKDMGRRLLQMWYKTHSGTHDAMLLFLNGGLLLLATVGITMIHSRWKDLSLLWFVISYYIILHMFLLALARYLLPVIPILTIFAMIPINELLNRWAILSSRVKSPAGI